MLRKSQREGTRMCRVCECTPLTWVNRPVKGYNATLFRPAPPAGTTRRVCSVFFFFSPFSLFAWRNRSSRLSRAASFHSSSFPFPLRRRPPSNEFSSSGQPTSGPRTRKGHVRAVVFRERYTCRTARHRIILGNSGKSLRRLIFMVELHRFIILDSTLTYVYILYAFFYVKKKLTTRKIKYFQRAIERVECLCSTRNFSIKIFSPLCLRYACACMPVGKK